MPATELEEFYQKAYECVLQYAYIHVNHIQTAEDTIGKVLLDVLLANVLPFQRKDFYVVEASIVLWKEKKSFVNSVSRILGCTVRIHISNASMPPACSAAPAHVALQIASPRQVLPLHIRAVPSQWPSE